jgi:hypothetical protein
VADRGAVPAQAQATIEIVLFGIAACFLKLLAVFLGAWRMWIRRTYWLAVLGACAAIFPIELIVSVITDSAAAVAKGAPATSLSTTCGWISALPWIVLGGWALALLLRHDIAARFDVVDPPPDRSA